MKIVIAGGTGFIGTYLANRYIQDGHDVIVIARSKTKSMFTCVEWTDSQGVHAAINHADLLINMAGKSVDCRYNNANKKAILESRVNTTRQLNEVVAAVQYPPKLWVNSSTATIYRHAEDRPMTESDGDIGSGFSVDVATAWEKTFFSKNTDQTREVALRTAIVLGHGGGAFKHFKMLTNVGFGGSQGSGKQMVSFVHIEDVYRAIEFLRNHENLSGVFNVSAPNPITNQKFMKTFQTKLKKRLAIPIFTWMLAIGAFFLRTETELLLKSRWVLPERLQKHGFTFAFNDINHVIQNLISTEVE